MDEQKKRKSDNGARKYLTPGSILASAIIIGIIVTFVANVRTVPQLAKKITENVRKIDVFEVKLDYIIEEMKELKDLIKNK